MSDKTTTRLLPDSSGQQELFEQSLAEARAAKKAESVECLGMTFENDEARRAYFTEKLKEKLADPEFRKIEGFPKGSDEDILRLSNPPYYTACPNPFLADFIRRYGKPYDPNDAITASRLPWTLARARPTRSTAPTRTTPRCPTWRSCPPSCTTPNPATSSSTASAVQA